MSSSPLPRLLLLLLLAAPARAQEENGNASPPTAVTSAEYRVLVFTDRTDSDCDPLAARFGACIEEVDFLRSRDLWEVPRRPTDEELGDRAARLAQERRRAVLRSLSHLHAFFWEDLAFRWGRSGDGVETTLRAAGLESLPPPARTWQPGHALWRGPVSLPPESSWLGDRAWGVTAANGASSDRPTLFRRLRTIAPAGTRSPRGATVLKGQFAQRLGFSGRVHPFDLMDASPASSGPFFEQLVPFMGAMESEDPRIRPLLHLSSPPQLSLLAETDPAGYVATEAAAFAPVVLEAEHFLAFRSAAAREFDLFRRSLGLHIVRFGLEEHTTNQMRILAALTAMERPPGWSGQDRTQTGRDLVAAAQGETDTQQEVDALIHRGARILDSGVRVRFAQLDPGLVDSWLSRPHRTVAPPGGSRDLLWSLVDRPPDALLDELNSVVIDLYGELLKVDPSTLRSDSKTYRLHSITKAALVQWASTWLKAGIDPQPIVGEIRKLALDQFVRWITDNPHLTDAERAAREEGGATSIPKDAAPNPKELAARSARRDELETWLLLDSASEAIGSRFDPTEGLRVAPAQVAEATRVVWSQVLLAHGYATEPVPQGLGAVDPLSACTTLDKVAALDEPSFGAINVDLLVAAEDGQARLGRVLWEARDQIPFLLIDDPATQEPEMARLVGLPGGRALYRLRYRIWSGWHVLWTPEPLTVVEVDEETKRRTLVPGERLRLAARTAALCSDTVLASHELVATLVRAAMLDGEFRPTAPVMPGDAKGYDEERAREFKDAQTVLEEAEAGGAEASAKAEEAGGAVTAVRDGGATGMADLAQGALEGASSGEANGIEYTPVSARVDYLRGVVQAPLRRMAQDRPGLLIEVFQVEEVPRGPRLDRPARTPYRRIQASLPGGDAARTASWGWWVPRSPDEPLGLVSPGYRAGNSVGSSSASPRWRRGQIADGWLTVGASFAPLRQTDLCRATSASDSDVVERETNKNRCVSNQVPPWSPDWQAPRVQSLRTEGFGLDIQGMLTIWGLGEPRVAFEVGGEVRLDVVHPGLPWFFEDDSPQFRRSITFRPAVGLMAGFRLMPLPGLARRGKTAWPWGSARPDGRAPLQRGQLGLRGGLLIGPGFNGSEGTGVIELWGAGSLRRRLGPRASFTPYQPATLLGPFVRTQLGFQLGPEDPGSNRNLRLVGSAAVLVGLRIQLRMTAPGKPETPAAPAAPEAP